MGVAVAKVLQRRKTEIATQQSQTETDCVTVIHGRILIKVKVTTKALLNIISIKCAYTLNNSVWSGGGGCMLMRVLWVGGFHGNESVVGWWVSWE